MRRYYLRIFGSMKSPELQLRKMSHYLVILEQMKPDQVHVLTEKVSMETRRMMEEQFNSEYPYHSECDYLKDGQFYLRGV